MVFSGRKTDTLLSAFGHYFFFPMLCFTAIGIGFLNHLVAHETPDAPVQETLKLSPTPLQKQLLDETINITEIVGAIRGLYSTRPIVAGMKNQDELRQHLLEALLQEISDENIENESKAYKRLGIFAPQIDYKALMIELLTQEIAGYYDRHTKELYIIQSVPSHLQRVTMAHEIFHGIQDQHFDLNQLLPLSATQENSDFNLARLALIEGDATLLMLDFMLYDTGMLPQPDATTLVDIPMIRDRLLNAAQGNRNIMEQLIAAGDDASVNGLNSSQSSTLSNAPLLLRELLIFPYLGGLTFAAHIRSTVDSWGEFNKIYEKPPVSTSQILHPEKYLADDRPLQIEFRINKNDDATLIYDNSFGELQTRLWLKTHLDSGDDDAASIDVMQAAKGWNGDRLHVYELSETNHLAIYLSSWENLDEAKEFYQALVAMTHRRFEGQAVHNNGVYGESLCFAYTHNDRPERLYIERWGDMVLYIEGAPSKRNRFGHETDPTTYQIRDDIWDSFIRMPWQD